MYNFVWYTTNSLYTFILFYSISNHWQRLMEDWKVAVVAVIRTVVNMKMG